MARPDQGIPNPAAQNLSHRSTAMWHSQRIDKSGMGSTESGSATLSERYVTCRREFAEVRTFSAVGSAPTPSASSTSKRLVAAQALA